MNIATGLSRLTTDDKLREAFSPFGQLLEAKVITDRISRRSKGFGFVKYATIEEAEKARYGMNAKVLDGWVIFVDPGKPKQPRSPNAPQPQTSEDAENVSTTTSAPPSPPHCFPLFYLPLVADLRSRFRFVSVTRTSPTDPRLVISASDAANAAGKMANAASGMAVNDDCKLKFLELKAKRTYRFIIYKIDEKQKQILVEKLGEPNLTYDDFTASIPSNECRYAIYDFDFVTEENCQKSKIFFIAWTPDTSRVRSKMLYASSKERFKRELDGIQVELQATDPTEMGLDVIRGRAN
ncbi:hypothetical protein ZIOFF_040780 [Zingiber officinale]|uniref:ADF-H domain-containing protein n=2 Tax=Zingiber officinale TaxID=94328 RepID=A0A8J5KVH2_ZINOF|nr:hypothetical protein ZIOFF_040780 [Zingiber officinale]